VGFQHLKEIKYICYGKKDVQKSRTFNYLKSSDGKAS